MSSSALINNRFLPRAQPADPDAGPWTEGSGVVYPDDLSWSVAVGVSSMSGAERFRVSGDALIEGKLTVTGIIDPTAVIVEDTSSQAAYLEHGDDVSKVLVRLTRSTAVPALSVDVVTARIVPLVANNHQHPVRSLAGLVRLTGHQNACSCRQQQRERKQPSYLDSSG